MRRAALLALIAVLIGCPKEEPPPDPMPGEAPLDRALLLANRSTTSLPLPAAEEAGYHVPTALPVVVTDALPWVCYFASEDSVFGISLGVALEIESSPPLLS